MAWYFGAAIVLPVLLALYFTKSLTTLQKRLILAALPVLLGIYLKFGDELKGTSVSWKDIIQNDKIISISENKQKTFKLKNGEISVSENAVISAKNVNELLLQWGINPSGMDDNNIKQKINLLLKVSSPDFWRKNYFIHPKKGRISNYLWIHSRYLNQLAGLKDYKDKDKLKKDLEKFSKKLAGHAYYEEEMMFLFLKENVAMDETLRSVVNDLNDEHGPFHNTMTEIINQCDTLNLEQVIEKIADFEKPLIQHFTIEEQELVPVFLNLENELYRKYRTYLSWKYYFMY